MGAETLARNQMRATGTIMTGAADMLLLLLRSAAPRLWFAVQQPFVMISEKYRWIRGLDDRECLMNFAPQLNIRMRGRLLDADDSPYSKH